MDKEKLERRYPQGTKIQLISMDDPFAVPPLTVGHVDFIDDAGQIHVKWETGPSLALIPNHDRFRVIS